MVRITTFFILFIGSCCIAFGQDYQTEFLKYCQKRDTANQQKVLAEWEKENPQDPELFTSYFNYYFLKSKRNAVAMSTNKPQEKGFAIKDSLGNTVGYLGDEIFFEQKEFKKGISKINEGIELYPNRLDMRFGKIYAFGQAEKWDDFTEEVIKTVQYSAINENNWLWTKNEKKDNWEDFFLLSIQDYQIQLYNTGDDSLLINMRNIANEILRYYPNHIESLSNLSISYLLLGEYDKGIEALLRAEKINPEDFIVLSNIAHGYTLKGNEEKALEYYEKTLKFGDVRAKQLAKKKMEEINSKKKQ